MQALAISAPATLPILLPTSPPPQPWPQGLHLCPEAQLSPSIFMKLQVGLQSLSQPSVSSLVPMVSRPTHGFRQGRCPKVEGWQAGRGMGMQAVRRLE